MSFYLKGSQHQFIFHEDDIYEMLEDLFEKSYVLFEDYVSIEYEKKPISNLEAFKEILFKEVYRNYKKTPQFWVVLENFADEVYWRKIELRTGAMKYEIDPMLSHAVQLLPSIQTQYRISIGRISVCTEWLTNSKEIKKATYEIEIYKTIRQIIKKRSSGRIGTIMVGKKAFEFWNSGKIALAYDLNNPETYDIQHYTPLKKSY